MHICIVTGQFPGLTETFITTKVLELARRGHRVTVITNQVAGAKNISHLEAVKTAGVEIISFAESFLGANAIRQALKNPAHIIKSMSPRLKTFKNKYRTQLQIELLTRSAYDIVHFEFSGLAIYYYDALPKLTAQTIVSCRGTAEKVKAIADPERAQQLRQMFSKMTAIHCVSADMATTIKQYCDEEEKIFVNRPSVDANVFKRTGSYVSHDRMQLLSVGRLTFQKGYLPGLLAVRELKDAGIECSWSIVGDGPQMEELVYHIHALDLTGMVHLLGEQNRDKILDLYNNTDIFFLPSIYEGIANVCLEAMSMEIPVVSSDCSGMGEVISHGVNGMLATNYSSTDMARHLLHLCNDFSLRKHIGENARVTIEQSFTLQRQVDVFERKYQHMMEAVA